MAGDSPCADSDRCDESAASCVAECDDADGDGYTAAACGGSDCRDDLEAIHPGAPELCNGIDNDCDDDADETLSCPGCVPTCGQHASCVQTVEGPTCDCDTGYAGDGQTCTDIDECAENDDDCDAAPNACVNDNGGFHCDCPTGYEGTGVGPDGCAEIDDCDIDTGFPGDEQCLVPPDPAKGIQIHIGPNDYDDPLQIAKFTMVQGAESSECFNFHTPNDAQIAYFGVQYSARPGTFRSVGSLFLTEHTDGGWTVCRDPGTGSHPDFAGTLIAVTGTDRPLHTAAPENAGLGKLLGARTPGQFDVHAFNATSGPLLRELWLNLYFVDADDVTDQPETLRALGGLAWLALPVQPGTDQVYRYECPITESGRILWLQSTMHAHNRRQSAWIRRGGVRTQKIFERFDWQAQRPFFYDSVTVNPPFMPANSTAGAHSGVLEVQAGDVLDWECHIVNDSSVGLTYTNAVAGGEMCNLYGETVGPNINCVVF